jgi:hypothetical protein
MMAPVMRTGSAICAAVTAILALGLAGCGEKEEPSAADLDEEAALQAEDELAPDFPIAGDWKGELSQKGLKPFTVTAEIAGPDGPNTVHYSGIDCSGRWTFEGEVGGDYTFNERIQRGQGGKCKGAGTVTLSPDADDTLGYEFRGGGVESRGTLERTG